jgi:hypothetical protein
MPDADAKARAEKLAAAKKRVCTPPMLEVEASDGYSNGLLMTGRAIEESKTKEG